MIHLWTMRTFVLSVMTICLSLSVYLSYPCFRLTSVNILWCTCWRMYKNGRRVEILEKQLTWRLLLLYRYYLISRILGNITPGIHDGIWDARLAVAWIDSWLKKWQGQKTRFMPITSGHAGGGNAGGGSAGRPCSVVWKVRRIVSYFSYARHG